MRQVSIFLIFTPIRDMVKYYEVLTLIIVIGGVGKEISPKQIWILMYC